MVGRSWELAAWREGGAGECVRFAVPARVTLARVQEALAREFQLPRQSFSFFLSGEAWDERTQFGSRGVDAPYAADETRVARLAWRAGAQALLLSHGADPAPIRLVVASELEEEAPDVRVLGRGPAPQPGEAAPAPELDEEPGEDLEDELEDDEAEQGGEEEAALGRWLGRMVRFAQAEPELAQPAMALSLFGGEEFRGLQVPEALPLFTGADSEMHFLLWAMLDLALPGEESVAQRYSRRWRSRGTPLERTVLDRVVDSRLDLIEIGGTDADGSGLVSFPLEPQRKPRRVQLGSVQLPEGLWAAARLIELDGEVQLLPGVLDYPTRESREIVSERLRESRAKSGLEWSLFLKRDGHRFHRAAREASLAAGLALAGLE